MLIKYFFKGYWNTHVFVRVAGGAQTFYPVQQYIYYF